MREEEKEELSEDYYNNFDINDPKYMGEGVKATRTLFVSLMALMLLSAGASAIFTYLYNIYGIEMPYWMLMLSEGLSNVFTFLLAGFIGVMVVEQRVCGSDVKWNVGIRAIIMSVVVILVCQPLVEWASYFNAQILAMPQMEWLREYMKEVHETSVPLMAKMLTTEVWWKWVVSIVVVSIVPAISEEMFFRGVIFRRMRRVFFSNKTAAILSAVFFAVLHLEADGILPRVVLGIILCVLYIYTGSLICPMVAHAVNNGLVILAYSMGEGSIEDMLTREVENPGPLFPILSVVALIWIFGKMKGSGDVQLTNNKQ